MKIIFVRHGQRPCMQNDKKILDRWRRSKRYKTNPLDEPITKKGKAESIRTGKKLADVVSMSKFKYIYSSPFTRCMETSCHLIDAIAAATGVQLRIRVEYALHESEILSYTPIITFRGDRIIKNYTTDAKSVIDTELKLSALTAKYGTYMDLEHKSYISDDAPRQTADTATRDQIKTVKRIIEAGDSALIVAHGGDVYLNIHNMILQNVFNEEQQTTLWPLTGGPDTANFVSIFKKAKNKWKLAFGPKRII